MDRAKLIDELQEARALIDAGDTRPAIAKLEKLIEAVPDSTPLYIIIARAYEREERYEEALQAWRDAAALEPESERIRTGAQELVIRIGTQRMKKALKSTAAHPVYEVETVFHSKSQPEPVARPRVRQTRTPRVPLTQDRLMLRASRLTKSYKRREVVKNVNLTVMQGEIVGLLGPNGAGKTTTFYMIVGLVRPDEGTILLGEENITRLPMYRRARRGIGYLAQEASIFRNLSVEDNLHAVLEYQKMSRADRTQRVDELISEFRLETVRRSKGYMLSGGERRRTEIARAIASKPRFFLLDEPFAGVDPIAVEDIQEIVASLREQGIGILITDHNVHETLAITDRAYLLYEGRIFMQGSAEALASDPEVRKRYLGEKFTLERY